MISRVPIVLISLVVFLSIDSSSSLFEDQIGKFDWKLDFVGKVKFSYIESKSQTKKIYVATEENVLAALSLKTGEILWRQVLERGDAGIIQFMNLDTILVTITGTSAPFVVRGWNANTGSLLFEWSVTSARWPDVRWALNQGKLVMASVGPSQLEVSVYNTRVQGQPITFTRALPLPVFKNRMVVSGNNFVYLDSTGSQLISVPLLDNGQSHVSLKLPAQSSTLSPIPGISDQSYVRAGNCLVLVTPEKLTLVQTLSTESEIAIVSYTADQNVIIKLDPVMNTQGRSYLVTCNVLETGTKLEEVTTQVSGPLDSSISKVFVSSVACLTRRDKTISCQLLLNSADHSIHMVQAPGNLVWTREEALTSITNVELVDLPASDIEVAIEKEFNIKEGGWVTMLARRVTSQLFQLQTLVSTVAGLREAQASDGRADLVRDDFGLHKIIVAVTAVGKVFGIDNLSHEILWQFTLEDVSPLERIGSPFVPMFMQRTTRHFPYPAECTLLFKLKQTAETIAYTFNPIDGKPGRKYDLEKEEKPYTSLGVKIVQAMLLPNANEEFLKGLLLLDSVGKIHVYPDSCRQAASEVATATYMYTADTETGLFRGYSLLYSDSQKLRAAPVWEIKLNQRVVALAGKSPLERVHSQGRVMADRSVLYKYSNPNLVVALTLVEDPLYKNVLSVYLIDVVSGSIVFSCIHKRILEPVHVVHSENWVVYSYFSDKSRRTEVNSLDLYEGKTQSNTTAFSSVWNPIQPIVERQSYILPANIETMKETITEKGITSKHVLVGLNSGGVMELPWVLVDPRRPVMPSAEAREEAVIPYMPELPLMPEAIVNYNQTLHRITGIHTAPSGLESTCLVVVYGLDIFYTRVAPSKTFDMLKEDFDYLLITAVLVGLTVSALMTKRLAARKALKQAWK